MDKQKIADLLSARLFDPTKVPPKEDIIFTIDGKTIGTLQNYVVFSGPAKAGKTTYLNSAIGSAFLPDFLDSFGMKIKLPENRKILSYFDTESSSYDFYRNMQRIRHFALKDSFPENLAAYSMREDAPEIIKKQIFHYLETTPECSVCIIDGFLDLCMNYNDEVETRSLTNWFKFITKKFNILLIGVLHISKQGETLGHLGANTDRWSQSTLIVEKNKETKQFVLKPKFLRSSEDFEPVALMNFDGKFTQVPYEQPTIEKIKKQIK